MGSIGAEPLPKTAALVLTLEAEELPTAGLVCPHHPSPIPRYHNTIDRGRPPKCKVLSAHVLGCSLTDVVHSSIRQPRLVLRCVYMVWWS